MAEPNGTVLGKLDSVSNGTNTIHCSNHSGFATSGLKTFILRLHYTFGGINTHVDKNIQMNVADLIDSVLQTVKVSNLTPSIVKVGQTCTFDLDCTVAKNDGVLTDLVVELDGAKIGSLISVVNGANKVQCSMPAQTTAGEKTIDVTLKYTLNGAAKTSVRTASITIADIVEPTLSIAMSGLTPADPKDGATVTYNMDCTVAKNDAATLTSLVVEDDSTALVGTETFTSTNVVEGVNTIACAPTATKTANTYTVKVTLNYTINGANKTLVKTLTYEVKAKALVTAGYVGKLTKVQMGVPNSSYTDVIVPKLTPEMIKKLPIVDPFVEINEVSTASSFKSQFYVWPTYMNFTYDVRDAIGNDLVPPAVEGTVGPFTMDIDGTSYTGFCISMQDAPITVKITKK